MPAPVPTLTTSGPVVVTDLVHEHGRWREHRVEDVIQCAAAAALQAGRFAMSGIAEIGVLLTDDNGIRALNRTWRGIDKPTNVLSFPAAPDMRGAARRHIGDVALAYETVEREAAAQGKDFGDHLAHLMVHGVLHLAGHDHADDDDAADMEAREVAALAFLGIGDPYAERKPAASKRARA